MKQNTINTILGTAIFFVGAASIAVTWYAFAILETKLVLMVIGAVLAFLTAFVLILFFWMKRNPPPPLTEDQFSCAVLREHLRLVMKNQDETAQTAWINDDRKGGGREDHHDYVHAMEMGERADQHMQVMALIEKMEQAEKEEDLELCQTLYYQALSIL